MGTGYTRNDTPNNIADGNVINASDLDGEFDAIQSAFNASTGHSHDGTSGEGPQIDTAGLADSAVTTAKINNDAVTLGTKTSGNYVGTITGGTGIDSTGATSGEGIAHTLNLDLNELPTSTTNTDGDYFVVVDSADGSQHKLTKANIALSGMNNDAGWTSNVGDITGVTAGTNLTGGGTSGTVTINMATGGVGSGTYGSTANNTKIDTITVDAYGRVTAVATGATGDIDGVTAGNGLTGGGTSGTPTLNVGAGTGIDVAADSISVDVSDFMSNGSNNRIITATGTDAMNAEANLTFDGSSLNITGDINAVDNIYLASTIYHEGDTNTYMQFHATDQWRVVTNSAERLEVNNASVTINEGGASYDFRVESDTSTHMLFVDGSANRIGINDSTPSYTLDVTGDINFTGTLRQNGTAFSGGGGLFKGENGEVGSSAGDIFRVHEQTLNTNVTIDSDENGLCAGPLTIAAGVTLTVNGNLSIV